MNDVRTDRCRESRGRLPTLLPVWPTLNSTSSSEDLWRAQPEDTTLSGQQVAPNLRLKPSRRVGWLLVGFPPKLLRNPRYGAFHIFAKISRDDPAEYTPHWHRGLGMGYEPTRTSSENNNPPAAEDCASSTRYTFRILAPTSTYPHRERKPALQTGAMAYAIATEWRLPQIGGLQTGAMAYAIATDQRIPQLGGQGSRRRDPSVWPHHFLQI